MSETKTTQQDIEAFVSQFECCFRIGTRHSNELLDSIIRPLIEEAFFKGLTERTTTIPASSGPRRSAEAYATRRIKELKGE